MISGFRAMRRQHLPILALLAIGCLALAGRAARAEPPPSTVIVLDGSGSMGGPLEGQETVKFDMAREAVRKAVTKARLDAPLGLVVVGHRRRGNCADVEQVIDTAPGTADAMMARLDKIGTVGKGPLMQGLREAARSIAPGAAGTLVLIHDDADNCRQDPCSTAAELQKTNPKLAVHVVTLSLEPTVAQVMTCLAKMTGGRQFVARDAASLERGVAEALRLANLIGGPAPAAPPDAAEEKVPPPVASTEGPPRIRLSAALADGGQPIAGAIAWRVAPLDSPGNALLEQWAAELAAPLPAGKYAVSAGYGLVSRSYEIDVAASGETALRLGLDAGALKVTATADKAGQALSEPLITVYTRHDAKDGASGGREALWVGRTASAELVLPAADYLVRVSDGLAAKEAPVSLTAGRGTTADFVMGTGTLALSAAAGEGGQELSNVTFLIEVDDPDAPQGRREIARSASPHPEFLLTAGTYYATARLGAAEARERIAIGTGDVVKRALPLAVGRLSVSTQYDSALAPPGTIASYRVYADGPAETEIAHGTEQDPDIFLPQGRYRIEARLGVLPVKGVAKAEITTGQSTKAVVTIETAELTLKSETGAGIDATWWEVRDGRGHVVMRSSQGTTKTAHLAPGPYTVRSEQGERKSERKFELKAGERRTIDAVGE